MQQIMIFQDHTEEFVRIKVNDFLEKLNGEAVSVSVSRYNDPKEQLYTATILYWERKPTILRGAKL